MQRPYHRDTRLLQPAEQLPDMQVIAVKVVQLDQIGPVRFHPPQQAAGGSGRTEACLLYTSTVRGYELSIRKADAEMIEVS